MSTPLSTRVERSNILIERARFMTLATLGPNGPWASTVNYVPLRDPLRLLWLSLRDSQHSRNIEASPGISGSIFLTGLDTELSLDGAQFTATAEAVGPGRSDELNAWFYERNFPNEEIRRQWRLPPEQLAESGPRRFYLATVREWWLLDTVGWLKDMTDRRIEVPLAALRQAEVAL
ncbi:pyridoxamine 5'-phosphate oxidase family protein [Streptomyces spectabilis]|uniref:Uncharacterized protein YhbP (UPF0306 family) n=1 Tax=Streptomyces spectabilis TaxID=68270 RepID=A0A7W8F0B9_STRST|nr:pyridoxamine 5'-phosphate oxidase family protein [Streptomyces spectabilis]MBB5110054.1 uncharacterized protein YhbP (UPF0306 family) [Streptomyces spectabilis]GGV57728.1 hypothetical protein GCM10010245_90830 [Streptomyces spectabilis]